MGARGVQQELHLAMAIMWGGSSGNFAVLGVQKWALGTVQVQPLLPAAASQKSAEYMYTQSMSI